MKVSEIQEMILSQTGIKTSVKKNVGSMKHHTSFRPMFQGGEYPNYPFEWVREFAKQFKSNAVSGNYCSNTQIDILNINISEYDPILYKKESKPKSIEELNVQQWGSKNSQMRLDKTAARYAKKRKGLNGNNMVKYW